MKDVIVSQVINQLSHFIMHRNDLRLDADEFETLREDMSTIQDLLVRSRTNVGVRKQRAAILTKRLDRVAYEIADMLEELNLMAVKPMSVEQRSFLKKVKVYCSSIPSPSISCSCSCFPKVPLRREFNFKISVYSSTLRVLLRETEKFVSKSKPELSLQADDDQHVGRDSDKTTLLEQLLAENAKEIELISIVGFLGSGKTTLARSLFDDDSVKQHFDVQAWTHVSNVFDEADIASQLFGSLGIHSPEKLEECFSGKTLLLVLDDVWTEDVLKWEPFRNSLRNNLNVLNGSKILVTTRSEGVARAACSDFVHSLGPLSSSDCWLISKGIAWKERPVIPREMVKIGKKIAKNCKGSPLIAKVVGEKLLHTQTPQEWQKVLDDGIWQMEEVATSLFSRFYMSYDELSPESRLCFWYCAFFPREHVINVDQLIRLWMAQGYFGYPANDEADDKVFRKKGMVCFNELANHCFFQDLAKDSIHRDKITSCKIQGAAHEFIKSMVSRYSADKKSKSFLSFSNSKVPRDLFTRMKHLRALVLSSCHLEQLPSEAEGLSLLQYLDLSCNPLKELPETVYKLYSLQFIDVCFCYLLSRLPQRIGEVKSLKHLRVSCTTDELHVLPQGFENLTWIQTVDVFRVGGKYDSNVQKLQNLNHLEDIRIAVHGKVHFPDADLGKKTEMENLELCFVGEGRDREMATCVEELVPPPNLEMLKMEDYPGLRLPKWILADSTISKLRRLSVRSASNISSLPSLWKLSSLEFLWLYDIPCMKRLGREFFGFPKTTRQHSFKENQKAWSYPMGRDDEEHEESSDDSEEDEEIGGGDAAFRCLKTLRIDYLKNWETWEDVDEDDEKRTRVMPSLEELLIADCPKLQGMPLRVLRDTPWFKKQNNLRVNEQPDDKPSTLRGKAVEIEEVQL